MTCYSPLKGFENKEDGGILFKRCKSAGKPIDVACGQCIGCRIDKSKEWAARIVHESQMHQDNCFITLTYDKHHLPWDGSLNKSHFQKFMKRLRKRYAPEKIRYFHCGEYGQQKGQRPHYHACLFGIDFYDRLQWSTANQVITYQSNTLQKIWGKGFATCGDLNYQTAAYTARYILKKITGLKAEEHYERIDTTTGQIINLQPEYITMSLRPGIGKTFYEKYQTDFFPRDECPIPGKGVYKKVPKYYERIYAEEPSNTLRQIKRKREHYRNTHADDYTPQRLEDQYKVKKAQLAHLPRHRE